MQLSTQSDATEEQRNKNIQTALALTFIVACLLVGAGAVVQGFAIPVFEKYSFHHYALALGIVAGFNQLQQVLINIYRVYGKLARIAFVELLGAVGPLLAVLLISRNELIGALLVSTISAGAVSLLVLLVKAPFSLSLSSDLRAAKVMLALGIPLIIFNASFYFITMAAQTILSIFYSIEAMAYYSLANSVTTAILLGVNSVIWIFFPNILFKTRQDLDKEVVARTVERVNHLFGTAVFIIAFAAILVLPLLFIILPQYKSAQGPLTVLLLSQAVFSLCIADNCLAIARDKQMAVAKISMLAAFVVAVLCLAVGVFHLPYIWISVSVLIGSVVFTTQQVKIGAYLINSKVHTFGHARGILPLGTIMSLLVSVAGCVLGYGYLGGLIGAIVYVATNQSKLKLLWNFGLQRVMRTEASS